MESAFEMPSYQGGQRNVSEDVGGHPSAGDKPGTDKSKSSVTGKPMEKSVKKRGRPKGASSASVSDVRREAAEDRRKLKLEYDSRIETLEGELNDWRARYDLDTARLNQELEILRRREMNYQQALGERLEEVASRLQETLLTWGNAELEEAQIDKRKRGRPRKTIK